MSQSKPPAGVRREKLDKNFKSKSAKTNVQWVDAFDSRIAIRGLGWLAENRKKKQFRRLPDRTAPSLSLGLQVDSYCPASVFLSFFSDAADISVRLVNRDATMLAHMAPTGTAGAELYFREGIHWMPMAVAIPSFDNRVFDRLLVSGLSRKMREYRLYLPLYKHLESLSLGLSQGAKIKPAPAPPGTKPIFFYGTSITQGGCANTAGSDFVSILGRMLDTETINFGFSGAGKGEPEVAELIREIDAGLFVLDYAGNCEPELLERTLPPFLRILRQKHPQTPVVLLGNVAFNQSLWDARMRDLLTRRRDVLMAFYLQAKSNGDAHIHYIDGDGILPPGLAGMYVDGIHPTSAGFGVMAERLAPLLNAIRIWHQS